MLPFIQFSLNQRKSRFTGISPNMMMFGDQLIELQDIKLVTKLLKQNFNTNHKDYKLIDNLIFKLNKIREIFKKDWENYQFATKKIYNKKYNIYEYKIKKNNAIFNQGKYVLYSIGDIQIANRKWRQRWSGPWKILERTDDRTAIIADSKVGLTKRVSINRLKLFDSSRFMTMKYYNDYYRKRIKIRNNKNDNLKYYMTLKEFDNMSKEKKYRLQLENKKNINLTK